MARPASAGRPDGRHVGRDYQDGEDAADDYRRRGGQARGSDYRRGADYRVREDDGGDSEDYRRGADYRGGAAYATEAGTRRTRGRSAAQDAGRDDSGREPSRRKGRAAAARLRKSRRRVYRWCGGAIVLCLIAAAVAALVTHHSPKPALYVTSLQPGEFKSVPNACTSVSASVLSQFLPGPGLSRTDELTGSTDSECSFTMDHKPDFLVLEVTNEQYAPFAGATGDGSASANALDNFILIRAGLASPPKNSPLPAAQITTLASLGQRAFSAFQRVHVTGIVTDKVTVVVLERNVVITVSLSGQESGHGFGPVPVVTLQAGAQAAAHNVLAKVLTQATA